MQVTVHFSGLCDAQLEIQSRIGQCSFDYIALLDYVLDTCITAGKADVAFCVNEMLNSALPKPTDYLDLCLVVEKLYFSAYRLKTRLGAVIRRILEIDVSLETITLEIEP